MLTFTWNDEYLARPTVNINKASLDDELRTFKRGIREVMSREHDWGPFSGNTGKHKVGSLELAKHGSLASRGSVSPLIPGVMYLAQDNGVSELYVYTGTAWVKVATNDHSALTDLAADVHPEYIKATGDSTIRNIDANGQNIEFSYTPGAIEGEFVTSVHSQSSHDSIGSLQAFDFLGLGSSGTKPTASKLSKSFIQQSIYVPPEQTRNQAPTYPTDLLSLPNIQVECPDYPFSDWLAVNPCNQTLYSLSSAFQVHHATTWHINYVRFNHG